MAIGEVAGDAVRPGSGRGHVADQPPVSTSSSQRLLRQFGSQVTVTCVNSHRSKKTGVLRLTERRERFIRRHLHTVQTREEPVSLSRNADNFWLIKDSDRSGGQDSGVRPVVQALGVVVADLAARDAGGGEAAGFVAALGQDTRTPAEVQGWERSEGPGPAGAR